MEKVLNYLKSNPNYVWGMIITFAVLILACVLGYFINKYNLLAFIDKWLDKNSKNRGKPTEKPKHNDDLPDFGFEFDSPEDLVAMERDKEKQNALSNSNANNASDEISHNDEIENTSSVEEAEEKKEDQPKKSKFSQMIHQSLQEYTHEDYEEYRALIEESNLNPSKISSMMSISVYEDTQAFSLHVTSTDPRISCIVSNAVHKNAVTIIQDIVPDAKTYAITSLQDPLEPDAYTSIAKNSNHEVRNAVLSFMVAAVMTVVFIWVYSFFDVVIRDRKKLIDNIDVPILGVIPRHEVTVVTKGGHD